MFLDLFTYFIHFHFQMNSIICKEMGKWKIKVELNLPSLALSRAYYGETLGRGMRRGWGRWCGNGLGRRGKDRNNYLRMRMGEGKAKNRTKYRDTFPNHWLNGCVKASGPSFLYCEEAHGGVVLLLT